MVDNEMHLPPLAMPLVGGFMIGSSVYHLLAYDGSILGASGIIHSVFHYITNTFPAKPDEDTIWKLAFVGGSIVAGAVLHFAGDNLSHHLGVLLFDHLPGDVLLSACAGVLVGLGTKLASGCTSGHMLCGLSRLSPRSIVATSIFFLTAILVSNLVSTTPVPPAPLPSPSLSVALPIIAALQLPAFVYRFTTSRVLSAFAIGAHFSLGLALAGMTRSSAVLGFMSLPLPFSPFTRVPWDPALLMVVVGALIPNFLAYQLKVKKMHRPKRVEKFDIPTYNDIDIRLVLGSLLFGAGWGLSGICPGPGLLSWSAHPLSLQSAAWITAMGTGGLAF